MCMRACLQQSVQLLHGLRMLQFLELLFERVRVAILGLGRGRERVNQSLVARTTKRPSIRTFRKNFMM